MRNEKNYPEVKLSFMTLASLQIRLYVRNKVVIIFVFFLFATLSLGLYIVGSRRVYFLKLSKIVLSRHLDHIYYFLGRPIRMWMHCLRDFASVFPPRKYVQF